MLTPVIVMFSAFLGTAVFAGIVVSMQIRSRRPDEGVRRWVEESLDADFTDETTVTEPEQADDDQPPLEITPHDPSKDHPPIADDAHMTAEEFAAERGAPIDPDTPDLQEPTFDNEADRDDATDGGQANEDATDEPDDDALEAEGTAEEPDDGAKKPDEPATKPKDAVKDPDAPADDSPEFDDSDAQAQLLRNRGAETEPPTMSRQELLDTVMGQARAEVTTEGLPAFMPREVRKRPSRANAKTVPTKDDPAADIDQGESDNHDNLADEQAEPQSQEIAVVDKLHPDDGQVVPYDDTDN